MPKVQVQFNLFKKWLFVLLFLSTTSPILVDVIVYIAPNKAVKYTMFFVQLLLNYYAIHQFFKHYGLLAKNFKP